MAVLLTKPMEKPLIVLANHVQERFFYQLFQKNN